MDKEKLEMWIEALEGGGFPQSTRSLCTYGPHEQEEEPVIIGFCCLGVATYLYDPEDPSLGRVNDMSKGGFVSGRVVEWLGIPLEDPDEDILLDDEYDIRVLNYDYEDWHPKQRLSLADMNDRGESFSVIAEVLRSADRIVASYHF